MTLPGLLNWEWLRIVVLSYPWLQPGHPDPHAENLRLIARALKCYVQDSVYRFGSLQIRYVNGGRPYGVLIDFTGIFQKERTVEEEEKFKLALPALNLFYSHPNTVVFKVTSFPKGYPTHPDHPYDLPPGSNTVEYAERGWCYAESAMSGLVKDSHKILDLGRLRRSDALCRIIYDTLSGREPPLAPGAFTEQLDRKTFTSKSADFQRVTKLYADAFAERIGNATALDYSDLHWGTGGVQRLLEALQSNRGLNKLNLGGNDLGVEGARMLSQALEHHGGLQHLELVSNNLGAEGALALGDALQRNSSLQHLNLRTNKLGAEGVLVLSEALERNSSLSHLNLADNNLGAEGAMVLGEALQRNSGLQQLELSDNALGSGGVRALLQALRGNRSSLRSLELDGNDIGGAEVLVEVLQHCSNLQALDLSTNSVGARGARALCEALARNRSLQSLVLLDSSVGRECADALAQALCANAGLLSLELSGNKDLCNQGVHALGKAMRANSSLVRLDLVFTSIGDEGAVALGAALEKNGALMALGLSCNSIGLVGTRRLARALCRNRAVRRLDLGRNLVDPEGAQALAKALLGNASLTVLNLGDAMDACGERTKMFMSTWRSSPRFPRPNSIGHGGARALGEALQRNRGLSKLNVSLDDVGEEGLDLLRQLASARTASGGPEVEISTD